MHGGTTTTAPCSPPGLRVTLSLPALAKTPAIIPQIRKLLWCYILKFTDIRYKILMTIQRSRRSEKGVVQGVYSR
jgi:hypothetical protein